jgi:hypothetical protein
LNDLLQSGSLSESPSEIFIHPDWNPFNQKYDADIAAIILDDDIPYTKFIRPICLSSTEQDVKFGFVAGWGESEDKSKEHENVPKQIKIPIHPNEHCFLESAEFVKISSKRTICGGSRDNTGPCRGDSGSGLFVKNGNSYNLKGIVSASLTSNGQCDVTNFALYSNVDKFIDWVQNPTEDLASKQSTTEQTRPVNSYTPPPSYGRPSYSRPTPQSSYSQPNSYARPNYNTATTQKPTATCGIMSTSKSLIQGGNQASRELFPWTVAILVDQSYGNFAYFSTGTLISDKHIVSTGLSFATLDDATQSYFPRRPEDFRMHFGISNLDQPFETGAFFVTGAAQVFLHRNIQHGYPRTANVGVLVLKNSIEFNNYISPACLPTTEIDIEEVEGRNAFAVGWGKDDSGKDSRIKNYVNVKIRSENDCDNNWSEYLKRGSASKFFCAGGDGRKSACYRDQPLYLKNDGKWFIRGLISIAFNLNDGKCDLNKPVLYEDLGQFNNWLKSLIN